MNLSDSPSSFSIQISWLYFASCFLLVAGPPPISTLFPYTTLFRSAVGRVVGTEEDSKRTKQAKNLGSASRSEERFSRNAETDLVCRLLLEKKKDGVDGKMDYDLYHHRVILLKSLIGHPGIAIFHDY